MRSSRAMKRWRIGSCSCSRSRTADAHADDRPADRPRSVAPKVAACPGPADPVGDRLDQLGVQPATDHEGCYPGRGPGCGIATHDPGRVHVQRRAGARPLLRRLVGGIALGIGQAFQNSTIINIGVGSRLLIPTDGLWHGAIFYLEPSDFLAAARAAGRVRAGNPFFADAALPVPYLLWIVAWILILLVLANWSFARRDL